MFSFFRLLKKSETKINAADEHEECFTQSYGIKDIQFTKPYTRKMSRKYERDEEIQKYDCSRND